MPTKKEKEEMEFTKIIDIDRARTIAMEMARGNSAVPDCTGENNAVRIMLHKSWPKYFNANGTLTTQHQDSQAKPTHAWKTRIAVARPAMGSLVDYSTGPPVGMSRPTAPRAARGFVADNSVVSFGKKRNNHSRPSKGSYANNSAGHRNCNAQTARTQGPPGTNSAGPPMGKNDTSIVRPSPTMGFLIDDSDCPPTIQNQFMSVPGPDMGRQVLPIPGPAIIQPDPAIGKPGPCMGPQGPAMGLLVDDSDCPATVKNPYFDSAPAMGSLIDHPCNPLMANDQMATRYPLSGSLIDDLPHPIAQYSTIMECLIPKAPEPRMGKLIDYDE